MLPKINDASANSTTAVEDNNESNETLGNSMKKNTLWSARVAGRVGSFTSRLVKDGSLAGVLKALRSSNGDDIIPGTRPTNQQHQVASGEGEAKTVAAIHSLETPLGEIRDGIKKVANSLGGMVAAVKEQSGTSQRVISTNRKAAREAGILRPAEEHIPTPGRKSMADYIHRARGWSTPSVLPTDDPEVYKQVKNQLVSSGNGESETSAYRQNEKAAEVPDAFAVNRFENEALKQLGDLFEKAFKNALKDSGGGLGGGGGGLGGFLGGIFGRGRKGGAAGRGSKVKAPPGWKPPQARDAKGRFIKTPPAVSNAIAEGAEGAAKAAGKGAGLLKGIGGAAGKALPFLGRAAGAVAVPVTAALDYKARSDEGQTTTQKVVGTASGAAGALAGGIAGAQGGALVGGGIGALFGGVGAAPGAAIGGVVGGIGGAIAGGFGGGKLADKFTGVGKPPKESGPTPQTKDLMSLQKTKEEKAAKREQTQTQAAATMVDARSTTQVVQQQNKSMIQMSETGKGYRGSLDLKKFTT